jgi:hypothetical protein
MSALAGLSVAANVFQVVGFADTVFRAGKSLYDAFERAQSTPYSIKLLLQELRTLLSIIASVRVFISEYATSPFAQDDGHILPNIRTVLMLIEQDFRHLRGLTGNAAGSRREGWLSLVPTNMRWALKEHEVTSSKHRLAQYTQSLSAALSVVGRYEIK